MRQRKEGRCQSRTKHYSYAGTEERTEWEDESVTMDLFWFPCPGWKVPTAFSPHLPLQEESRGWCFSQQWCVCEEGGRSLWDSEAALHRSQLCQTPPGSFLPGRLHPLQPQVAEAMLCRALCQTGTYKESREGNLGSGRQSGQQCGLVCLW